MSWMDVLKKQVLSSIIPGGSGGQQADVPASSHAAIFESVAGMLMGKGLASVVHSFEQNGLGGVVKSWVGTGENQPATPDQVTTALGLDTITGLARKAGISTEQASAVLAKVLPSLVDKFTPHGVVDEVDAGSLPTLSGLPDEPRS